MIVSPMKLKHHTFRTPLAKPEIFNGRPRQGADSPWHGKDFALPEVDERLMASWIGTL